MGVSRILDFFLLTVISFSCCLFPSLVGGMFSGAPCLVFSVFSTRYSLAPCGRWSVQIGLVLGDNLRLLIPNSQRKRQKFFSVFMFPSFPFSIHYFHFSQF